MALDYKHTQIHTYEDTHTHNEASEHARFHTCMPTRNRLHTRRNVQHLENTHTHTHVDDSKPHNAADGRRGDDLLAGVQVDEETLAENSSTFSRIVVVHTKTDRNLREEKNNMIAVAAHGLYRLKGPHRNVSAQMQSHGNNAARVSAFLCLIHANVE